MTRLARSATRGFHACKGACTCQSKWCTVAAEGESDEGSCDRSRRQGSEDEDGLKVPKLPAEHGAHGDQQRPVVGTKWPVLVKWDKSPTSCTRFKSGPPDAEPKVSANLWCLYAGERQRGDCGRRARKAVAKTAEQLQGWSHQGVINFAEKTMCADGLLQGRDQEPGTPKNWWLVFAFIPELQLLHSGTVY